MGWIDGSSGIKGWFCLCEFSKQVGGCSGGGICELHRNKYVGVSR